MTDSVTMARAWLKERGLDALHIEGEVASLAALLDQARQQGAAAERERIITYVAGRVEYARKAPRDKSWAYLHALIAMIDEKSLRVALAVNEMTMEECVALAGDFATDEEIGIAIRERK